MDITRQTRLQEAISWEVIRFIFRVINKYYKSKPLKALIVAVSVSNGLNIEIILIYDSITEKTFAINKKVD